MNVLREHVDEWARLRTRLDDLAPQLLVRVLIMAM